MRSVLFFVADELLSYWIEKLNERNAEYEKKKNEEQTEGIPSVPDLVRERTCLCWKNQTPASKTDQRSCFLVVYLCGYRKSNKDRICRTQFGGRHERI